MHSKTSLRSSLSSEWLELGEAGLRSHLTESAVFAHSRYHGLKLGQLSEFLQDPECVRYRTRMVFGFGTMSLHQFAHVQPDPESSDGTSRVLYVRPHLRRRGELLPLAVAYLVPVINYGEIAADELCTLYGATLLGKTLVEFYREVCSMADQMGSEPRFLDPIGPLSEPMEKGCPVESGNIEKSLCFGNLEAPNAT